MHYIRGAHTVIVDAPLLIESGMVKYFSTVVVVNVSQQTQKERLMKRNVGMSSQDADARIHSQMPLSEKCKLATTVIDNEQSLEDTHHQLDVLVNVAGMKSTLSTWEWLLYRVGLLSGVTALTMLAGMCVSRLVSCWRSS